MKQDCSKIFRRKNESKQGIEPSDLTRVTNKGYGILKLHPKDSHDTKKLPKDTQGSLGYLNSSLWYQLWRPEIPNLADQAKSGIQVII